MFQKTKISNFRIDSKVLNKKVEYRNRDRTHPVGHERSLLLSVPLELFHRTVPGFQKTARFYFSKGAETPFSKFYWQLYMFFLIKCFLLYWILYDFIPQNSRPVYLKNFEEMQPECHQLSNIYQNLIIANLCKYSTK